jgi:CRISPR-associated endonuclease/helicase Cas3
MTSFRSFYEAVYKRPPFRWQERLAEQVLAEGWPEEGCIGPPTASGKTTVVDIAVFALASQSERPLLDRTTPLRTFFVVDRRLVVDDVTRHAKNVRRMLIESEDPAIREIRKELCRFGAPTPLEVCTLRGGMYRSDVWADRPNQPLVCVSTVDQVGSRLLFRGYGCGDRRRSIDAGLTGCDSLIILDEAHLSQPFVETVRGVQRYQRQAGALLPCVRLISMSATSLSKGFELTPADFDDENLHPRLVAEKSARLLEAMDLEGSAEVEALRLMKDRSGVVGIVVNTVNAARRIYERLKTEGDSILLTGRVRPFDRDRIIKDFLPRIEAGRERKPEEKLFVVATQTIEVGADLDFDGLVTEAAPLDALRQRFGRLDRLGKLRQTSAVVLKRKRGKDPVYGENTEHAWVWLNSRATAGVIDFGAAKMRALYNTESDEEKLKLTVKSDQAPVMFPAHVETWVQTCPTPGADPDVAPFLHGRDSGNADVSVVWRADLEDESDWRSMLDIAPPTVTEALPLPIWTAKNWLTKGDPGPTADLEGVGEKNGDQTSELRQFLIWRGPDEKPEATLDAVRPGDTIIVRSTDGGCDEFGWNPDSTAPVPDIGDLTWNERVRQAGGRRRVRMHPSVYPERKEELAELFKKVKQGEEEAEERLFELALGVEPELLSRPIGYGTKGAVCYQTSWLKPREEAELPADETDDDTASLRGKRNLKEHTKGVLDKVRRFTEGCRLQDEVSDALRRAAELHDIGKADPRFQLLLGGIPGELLAKGDPAATRAELERLRADSGYPRGARHELWSVALAQSGNGIVPEGVRDLVLHLIGTHHGYGRPFAPIWSESGNRVKVDWDGAVLQAESDDVRTIGTLGSGCVDRFWRLNERYGCWGLAYLEAILRRADCVQSRLEEEGKA